jgi:[acyl-carrier-protein] S-malonyltransferase
MNAYIFPGQGSQFPGMGKDLYENASLAKEMFEKANDILGFRISDIMFDGTEEDLRQTKVTQPAIFLHSVILSAMMGDDFNPDTVAGHSLGEFSALVANKTLRFEDALKLVSQRALAMQKACEIEPSTMAAVLGMDEGTIVDICQNIHKDGDIVVPANFNTPGQIVISGSLKGIDRASELLLEMGAKRVVKLSVGGAFHSPLMEPARQELEKAITETEFATPICPIYQNFTAEATTDPEQIRYNLIMQLTSPVKWTQTLQHMVADGVTDFVEIGPGKVLSGMVKKVDRKLTTLSIQTI